MATPNNKRWIACGDLAPHDFEDQSADRSKLGGQLGVMSFTSSAILPLNTTPNLLLTCDKFSTFQQVDIPSNDMRLTGNHVENISLGSINWAAFPFEPKLQDTYEHRDNLYLKGNWDTKLPYKSDGKIVYVNIYIDI